jgi:hypothetical protein
MTSSLGHYHKHYFSIQLGIFNHWTFLSTVALCVTLFATAAYALNR